MLNDQQQVLLQQQQQELSAHPDDDDHSPLLIRDVHALTHPHLSRPSGVEMQVVVSGLSRRQHHDSSSNTRTIGDQEEEFREEINALAIVPETTNPTTDHIIQAWPAGPDAAGENLGHNNIVSTTDQPNNDPASTSDMTSSSSVYRVRKEEVETKINAWQTAKIAKINNRFKRDDSIINGWEREQVHKANSGFKKIQRKLEEKRVKAQEKMQNEIAKAHRKAEERRASAEAKRGTKVARILEIAHLMKAVGRPPAKRSFF